MSLFAPIALGVVGLLPAHPAHAEVAIEETGKSLELPRVPNDHWIWVGDIALSRAALFNADDATMLGMIDFGPELRPAYPQHSRDRGEIYAAETFYSRGNRGERKDIVTIYDATSLLVLADIEIPAKTADGGLGPNYLGLLDNERFLLLLNQNPATSITVVDVEARRFIEEIQTPGCALVYPCGPQRFLMLCGDGRPMVITLDDTGHEQSRVEGDKFFDPTISPITAKGTRVESVWYFTNYEGTVHGVDTSGGTPKALPPWSLVSDAERADGWRPGGRQLLAAHADSGRLFAVMHQGGPGTHKNPGPEVWVFDISTQSRTSRIKMTNLMVPFLETQAVRGTTAQRPGGNAPSFLTGVARRVAGWIVPNPGADSIVVTRDENPLLIAGNLEVGAVAVFDANTGEHLRDIAPTGITGGGLTLP